MKHLQLPQIPPSCPPQVAATTWARSAGKIARRYFKNVSADYKPDNSVLTRADMEIEEFLVGEIRRTYPDHGVLGEEGARTEINSSYLWAIDPLDGTTAFMQGLPGWGISLGLLYDFKPIFGLFYMPLLDDMTYTISEVKDTLTSERSAASNGICCNGQILRQTVRVNWGRKGFLGVSTGAHHDFKIDVLRTRALGSVGASLIYTARGSATAAFIPKAYLWDLVAGACILKQAGGELRYLSGKPIDYESLADGSLAPEPIITGHPNLLAELEGAILPRVI